jgi:phage N-6-adenine-methyltransferase
MHIKPSDEWQTPQWLFDELNKEFNFCVDMCATLNNKKCKFWISDVLNIKDEDLDQLTCCNLEKTVGFMNPPYSFPKPFIERAWQISEIYKVVCLVKADTSTKWWGIFWDYDRINPDGTKGGAKPGCEVRFLPRRVKFVKPDGSESGAANFPSAIIIMDRRNLQ